MEDVIIGPSGEQYLCLRDVGDSNEVVGNSLTKQYNPSIISQYHNGRLTTVNLVCQNCDFFGCVVAVAPTINIEI